MYYYQRHDYYYLYDECSILYVRHVVDSFTYVPYIERPKENMNNCNLTFICTQKVFVPNVRRGEGPKRRNAIVRTELFGKYIKETLTDIIIYYICVHYDFKSVGGHHILNAQLIDESIFNGIFRGFFYYLTKRINRAI